MLGIFELKEKVIDNNYCIGCGTCSYYTEGMITIVMNKYGKYEAKIIEDSSINCNNDPTLVCPFYSKITESDIANELYGSIENIKHNEYEGYYLNHYGGYVVNNDI